MATCSVTEGEIPRDAHKFTTPSIGRDKVAIVSRQKEQADHSDWGVQGQSRFRDIACM
jgi:hypothetical protein